MHNIFTKYCLWLTDFFINTAEYNANNKGKCTGCPSAPFSVGQYHWDNVCMSEALYIYFKAF
jgi:hypothetical protein